MGEDATFQALGGHDRGPSGLVRLSAQGVRHTVYIAGWTVRPWATWQREQLAGQPADGRAFLSASPTGSTTATTFSLAAARERHGLQLRYRSRDIDVESGIARAGQSAGRVAYVHASSAGWGIAGWRRIGGRWWRASIGRERVDGVLSARVETWPFLSLWESLSAHAYRLNGRLDGDAVSVRFGSSLAGRADGWTWAAIAGGYAVRLDRDSWYVTSFGFGRRDREQVSNGADPAYLVGGELARSLSTSRGHVRALLVAVVPVHARAIDEDEGAPDNTGIAGYLRMALAWTRVGPI